MSLEGSLPSVEDKLWKSSWAVCGSPSVQFLEGILLSVEGSLPFVEGRLLMAICAVCGKHYAVCGRPPTVYGMYSAVCER